MKRYLSIFLVFLVVFSFILPSFSYADIISDLNDTGLDSQIQWQSQNSSSSNTSSNSHITEESEQPGILQKVLDIIVWPCKALSTVLSKVVFLLPTIDECIFNTSPLFRLSFFESAPSGLVGHLQGSISAIYNALRYLVTAIYIVILVYLAIRMMLSSIGRQKAHYKELFKHWIVGLLLLFSFHWVMAFFIWLANTFVKILYDFSTALFASGTSSIIAILQNANAYSAAEATTYTTNSPLTTFVVSRIIGGSFDGILKALGILGVVVSLVSYGLLIASCFSILFTYLKRLFTISVLILLFPLIALSYVFDKIGDRKAQTFGNWFKEFTVNVMIQPLHALILLFIAMLYSTGLNPNASYFGPNLLGIILSLAALRLIPLGEDLLKNLFQIKSSMGPGAGGIAASMAHAGMAYNGAKTLAKDAKNMTKNFEKFGKNFAQKSAFRKQAGLNFLGANSRSGKWLEKRLNASPNEKAHDLAKKLFDRKTDSDGNSKMPATRKDAQDAYKELLKQHQGSDNAKWLAAKNAGNFAAGTAKTLAQLAGASLGVGTALTSAKSGQFLSTASTNAVAGASIAGAAFSAAGSVLSTPLKAYKHFMGDLNKAEDYVNRANKLRSLSSTEIDNLDQEEKKKLALELGIKPELITGGNKDLLVKAYEDMGRAARFGASKDDLKHFNSFAREAKNIENGLMPDGSGPLELSKFDAGSLVQTKNGMFATRNGTRYQLNTDGNSDLKDGEEISIPGDMKGKSLKEIMDHVKNSEYENLKVEKSNVSTALEKQEETVRSLEIARDEAKDDKNAARKIRAQKKAAYDAASQTGDVARTQAAEAEYILAQKDFDAASQKYASANTAYSLANSDASTLRSREKQITQKMENIEEKTVKAQRAAEKASMKLGSDPVFVETAYTAAQNTEKYPNAQYVINDSGAYVDLGGNGQEMYTIQKHNIAGIESVAFDPSTISGSDPVNLSSDHRASYDLFSSIVNEQLNQYTAQPEETLEGFHFAVCPNVDTVLTKHATEDYSIKLTRINDSQLQYYVYDENGQPVKVPHNIIEISGSDSSFNCDKLANLNDSITIVYEKGAQKKPNWFIKKT